MQGTAAANVEMTCLQGLADLERLEGPWLECVAAGAPESVATVMRLMVAHMAVLNKRLVSSMVLDRLDMELSTTRMDVHNDAHDLGMSTEMSTGP